MVNSECWGNFKSFPNVIEQHRPLKTYIADYLNTKKRKFKNNYAITEIRINLNLHNIPPQYKSDLNKN